MNISLTPPWTHMLLRSQDDLSFSLIFGFLVLALSSWTRDGLSLWFYEALRNFLDEWRRHLVSGSELQCSEGLVSCNHVKEYYIVLWNVRKCNTRRNSNIFHNYPRLIYWSLKFILVILNSLSPFRQSGWGQISGLCGAVEWAMITML